LSLFLLLESVPGGSDFEKILVLYLLTSQTENGLAVEVGVMFGKSAIAIAAAAKESNSTFMALDTWNTEQAAQYSSDPILIKSSEFWDRELMQDLAVNNIHFFNDDSIIFKGDSNTATHYWETQNILPRRSVTFLHIDANHDYDKVVTDIRVWLPFLASENIVVFDDTSWTAGNGPRKLVDLLAKRAKYKKVKDIAGSTIFWNLEVSDQNIWQDQK